VAVFVERTYGRCPKASEANAEDPRHCEDSSAKTGARDARNTVADQRLSNPTHANEMSLKSAIEWTEATWNPVTGCSKISPGCQHCYAERMSLRLRAIGSPKYRNGFKATTHETVLDLPLGWKRPKAIFVNSMSDLFHKEVPLCFIKKVFAVMQKANWHRYQILTKRAERLAELADRLPWTPNIWQGVTVEHPDYSHRIDLLRGTGAHIKFLSLEPLLAPMPQLNLRGIHWVILGGESGPGARPMQEQWATDIRD